VIKAIEMRRAEHKDLAAIVALLADDDLQKLASNEVTNMHEAAFSAIDADSNQILAVAVVSGEIVGCAQLTFIPGLSSNGFWRCHIEAVRVARAQRGQGFGAQMFDWIKSQARAKNCQLMQLLMDRSRTDAHRFYESQGFQANHHGFRQYFQGD
jgi:GNAT superfamily N-acetyltransferase